MGFLDELKYRLGMNADDYDDYDDYEDEEEYGERSLNSRSRSLEGNSYYGREAESVTYVKRGGDRTTLEEAESNFASIPRGPVPAARRDSYATPSIYSSRKAPAGSRAAAQSPRLEDYYIDDDTENSFSEKVGEPSFQPTHASIRREMEVLRPVSYAEVEDLVSIVVNDKAPLVLVLNDTKPEISRRILDFSFGLTCGVNGSIDRLADRVFALLPKDVTLTDDELSQLKKYGVVDE